MSCLSFSFVCVCCNVGNSTKFTAKTVKHTMEWVVAIKEAIRVQEEREREEVSKEGYGQGGGTHEEKGWERLCNISMQVEIFSKVC